VARVAARAPPQVQAQAPGPVAVSVPAAAAPAPWGVLRTSARAVAWSVPIHNGAPFPHVPLPPAVAEERRRALAPPPRPGAPVPAAGVVPVAARSAAAGAPGAAGARVDARRGLSLAQLHAWVDSLLVEAAGLSAPGSPAPALATTAAARRAGRAGPAAPASPPSWRPLAAAAARVDSADRALRAAAQLLAAPGPVAAAVAATAHPQARDPYVRIAQALSPERSGSASASEERVAAPSRTHAAETPAPGLSLGRVEAAHSPDAAAGAGHDGGGAREMEAGPAFDLQDAWADAGDADLWAEDGAHVQTASDALGGESLEAMRALDELLSADDGDSSSSMSHNAAQLTM
jgi:hypothetical protein